MNTVKIKWCGKVVELRDVRPANAPGALYGTLPDGHTVLFGKRAVLPACTQADWAPIPS